jgi:hypothetical protein
MTVEESIAIWQRAKTALETYPAEARHYQVAARKWGELHERITVAERRLEQLKLQLPRACDDLQRAKSDLPPEAHDALFYTGPLPTDDSLPGVSSPPTNQSAS